MKKCIDCKHIGREYCVKEQCVRKGKVIDPRTGFEEDPPYSSCERDAPWPISWILGTCGRRGRFFEPKKKEDTR